MRPTDAQIDAVLQAALDAPGTKPISIGPNCDAHWAFIYAIEWACGREPTGEWIPGWAARLTMTADKVPDEDEDWLAEYDRVNALWSKEIAHYGPLDYATPSVKYEPGEIAASGWAIFIDDGFISEIHVDPLWIDVLYVFDIAIKFSGDQHHCFLEGIQVVPPDKWPPELKTISPNTTVYTFVKGS